jgi:hypothetical protein
MPIVRCREPRKNAKHFEECKGFVGKYPEGEHFEFVRIVGHSTHAHPLNSVWVCSKCGRLHEYRRAEAPRGVA